jgi:uncharacterized protein (TIGR02246 family)
MNNQERDVNSISELERKAREAAKAKDLDQYVSFYVDDAVLLWPGAPMITGRAAIRKFMQVFFSMPDFSLSLKLPMWKCLWPVILLTHAGQTR